LFNTFPPAINFIFWVLVAVLTPRILKDDIWGDVVIGFSKKFVFPVFLRAAQPPKPCSTMGNDFDEIKNNLTYNINNIHSIYNSECFYKINMLIKI